jgi:hypothetical protein
VHFSILVLLSLVPYSRFFFTAVSEYIPRPHRFLFSPPEARSVFWRPISALRRIVTEPSILVQALDRLLPSLSKLIEESIASSAMPEYDVDGESELDSPEEDEQKMLGTVCNFCQLSYLTTFSFLST